MSPSRAPPGDAINRCRDAVDAIQSATSHKYSRDRAELVHLLGSPHIQVSDDFWDYKCFRRQPNLRVFMSSQHARRWNLRWTKLLIIWGVSFFEWRPEMIYDIFCVLYRENVLLSLLFSAFLFVFIFHVKHLREQEKKPPFVQSQKKIIYCIQQEAITRTL